MNIEAKPAIENYQRLVQAIQELSMARDLNTVMQIVRSVARELTGADGATFVLKDGDQCFYADEDSIEPLWKGKRFKMSDCVSGWVMKYRSPVVIEDVFSDERIPAEVYKQTFVKSVLMVPIRSLDPIGAIGAYWARKYKPSASEQDLLQSLANITAVTLENIRVHDELEKRVQNRTKELEEKSNELESFTYSVSHDLRSPLRGINGFMNILLEDHANQLDDDAKKLIGRVLENAQHMTALIDNLLTYFKIGQKELLKSKLPMKLIATEICDDLRAIEKRRYISVNVQNLPEIYGDNILIKQLWLTLISNAIKYSSKKQKTFIEIGSDSAEGETVFYVKDNGAGFDMNYYHNLFGVFKRLHSQKEFEGTGIGLAIAEKIVQRHGGRIWAESTIDEGSCFYFTIPLTE